MFHIPKEMARIHLKSWTSSSLVQIQEWCHSLGTLKHFLILGEFCFTDLTWQFWSNIIAVNFSYWQGSSQAYPKYQDTKSYMWVSVNSTGPRLALTAVYLPVQHFPFTPTVCLFWKGTPMLTHVLLLYQSLLFFSTADSVTSSLPHIALRADRTL